MRDDQWRRAREALFTYSTVRNRNGNSSNIRVVLRPNIPRTIEGTNWRRHRCPVGQYEWRIFASIGSYWNKRNRLHCLDWIKSRTRTFSVYAESNWWEQLWHPIASTERWPRDWSLWISMHWSMQRRPRNCAGEGNGVTYVWLMKSRVQTDDILRKSIVRVEFIQLFHHTIACYLNGTNGSSEVKAKSVRDELL